MKSFDVLQEIRVDLAERGYPILIGAGILEEIGAIFHQREIAGRILVITNPTVAQWYLDPVLQSLQRAGYDAAAAQVPDGETFKSLAEADFLYDRLVEGKYDRKTVLVALGGGVIGDLTGFVAATYMRGVRFVQVPTTLLAQVDSSVGGKVAVNHRKGKNLIGAFYQPRLVLTDVTTLRTLPDAEFSSGMAEVIKHGIILDPEYYRMIGAKLPQILRRDPAALSEVVGGSCRIKAEVVRKDEKEQNLRAILNFGHTVGHALESITGYTRYKHGEAVALGMLAATKLAERSGLLADQSLEPTLRRFCQELHLPLQIPGLDSSAIAEAILLDKKADQGAVRWILPLRIGEVRIEAAVPQESVVDILKEMGGA
ncbi:3-dehydroquinate synthase [Hydrogenispora ethanolica]|uniref:3-dehydroquinate synthase n=1 Tax=Hydrogenispora ethanolica TaxID=1082276 RepID=A0A4R1RWG0_HYDET|nr:3-dehydroquinate synthase [Hydrogenispora ethanolica]TCL70784.1 3-dehydroquinate synthase [Hydrogenispora ethanolica]